MNTENDSKGAEEDLRNYIDTNDFRSALRTRREDAGTIYGNEIIHGWIEDTFKYAYSRGIAFERKRADGLVAAMMAAMAAVANGDETTTELEMYHILEDALAEIKGGE